MSRLFLIRLLLSALAIVCEVLVLLDATGVQSESTLPFTTERNSQGEYVIRPLHVLPVPAPFRDGDVLSIRDLSLAGRAVVFASGRSIPSGTSAEVVVLRAGRLVRSSVTSVRTVPTPPEILRNWNDVVGMLVIFVLAMLTLWRGRDWTAWALSAFSLAVLLQNALSAVAVHPPDNLWLRLATGAIDSLVTLPALYAMSEGLARRGLPGRTRMATRIAVVVLALTAFGIALVCGVGLIYYGFLAPPWLFAAHTVILSASGALPVLILLSGYRRAGYESRLRIRWVLWSTALLFATIVALLRLSLQRDPFWYLIVSAAQGLSLVGYLYAVLRARIVDITFAIDRALIFAVITALLFGCFSLLEKGLSWLAVGERVSAVLEAAAALLVSVALSPVHRRIEQWVENLFFYQQHLAVTALRRFSKECAFIERDERLLQIASEHLVPHCAAVAIYERTQSGYLLREGHGASWPEAVDADDPLFISLRAHRQELDLKDITSAIGAEGLAVPMAVADLLTGALVCLARTGEQFAPDVRAALAEVARNLGTSLYVLRYREQARLVADIAGSRIDAADARTRAIALIATGT